MQCIPKLRFVVESICQGIDTIVIVHRSQDNMLSSKVLWFSGDVVIERHGIYFVPIPVCIIYI